MIEAKKLPEEIFNIQMKEGLTSSKKSSIKLFLSGLSAGLDISFSLILMVTVISLLGDDIHTLMGRLSLSLMYSVGFIFVIIGRSELFTEHTALEVLPFLKRKISLNQLLKSWFIIWLSNLIGIMLFTLVIINFAVPLDVIDKSSFSVLANELLSHSAGTIFFGAILAGWLMGLLSWVVSASKDTFSQLFLIIMVTSTIGFLQLHHSILGSGEVLLGVFTSSSITIMHFISFLGLATAGNIVGGSLLVAIIKSCHVDIKKAEN